MGQIFWWWFRIQSTATEIRGMSEDRVLSWSSNDAARWFCKRFHGQNIHNYTGTDGLLTLIWITIFPCTKANNSFNPCYGKSTPLDSCWNQEHRQVKSFVNLPWALWYLTSCVFSYRLTYSYQIRSVCYIPNVEYARFRKASTTKTTREFKVVLPFLSSHRGIFKKLSLCNFHWGVWTWNDWYKGKSESHFHYLH